MSATSDKGTNASGLNPSGAPLEMIRFPKELAARIREMRSHFLVPPSPEAVFAEYDPAVLLIESEYQQLAKSFRHTVAATLSTVAVPFQLASSSAEHNHYQRHYLAEIIRSGADADAATEILERVQAKAHERMREFVESEDGRNAVIRDTCEFLLRSLPGGLEFAAQELLQQGLVLLWSGFEVFFRDAFELFVNDNPTRVQLLVTDPVTRKRFEAQRFSLDTLVRHGFDLSTRLGTVLVEQQDFSDLTTIKAVYTVLFGNNDNLMRALADRELWTLYQRRHLVVHRRGVVDQAYLDATGESVVRGTRLSATPGQFEIALTTVVRAGKELLHSLRS